MECFTCYRGMSKEHLNPSLVRAVRKAAKFFRFRFDPEPDICPTDAIVPEELSWPRVVRRAFSDPQVPHESTGIHGRGTAEVKTNDVTGRVKEGEAGFVIEFGRPGVGARFRDIERVTKALAELGVEFESNNPVTSLMTDSARGLLRHEILQRKDSLGDRRDQNQIGRVPAVLTQSAGAFSRSRDSDQHRRVDSLRRRRRRTAAERSWSAKAIRPIGERPIWDWDESPQCRIHNEKCKMEN